MKARFRDLTAKYKYFRKQPDALFLSRTTQTFFNKFTKKGKKALARRHIERARVQVRLTVHHLAFYRVFVQSLRLLETPILLLYARKGKEWEIVAVPNRRNKKQFSGLQTLYSSRQARRERDLHERFYWERLSVVGAPSESALLRSHSEQNALLYEEGRLNLKRRWR